ncbi:ABC transporter substrate-binding protein [Rudanella paleaurantiibacter]|uniref:ABC transporter substrate-binding protein n=1 Tax=Rudanella paleaurantiibacter TaxID=2614655 RepID=UPI001FEB3283|nr:ABC transporter substrate-binding protein [Rudanella paleaurantiibacter]
MKDVRRIKSPVLPLILALLLTHANLWAQLNPEVERRYRAAVKMVQLGDYEKAKTELQPIMQRGTALSPFAYYHHAIASFRQRNFGATVLTVRQLLDKFPDWRKKEDANYLLASALFETGKLDEAIQTVRKANTPELRADVDQLERHFYSQITDLNRLKVLQRQYPDNRNLGLALVELIQQKSTDKNDLELSDRLSNRFGVPAPTPGQSAGSAAPVRATPTRTGKAKGYYNVAVLFPFRVDGFDAEKRLRANQYVYDLYDGMKMAKAKLQSEGVTVNLFAYDIDNNEDKTLELLNNPTFAQTDLVFGPLYAEPNRLVRDFTNQNGLVLVNPIATSSELVTNQPSAFLAQASLGQQAEQALAFVKSLGVPKKVAIYYGASRRDSTLAATYQTDAKKAGYQVMEFRKLTGNGVAMAAGMTISDVNKPGHVFFVSSNDEDGSNLSDALSRRKVSSPLLATASAFDFYKSSSAVFARRETYLIYPEFIDPDRPAAEEFQKKYLAERNIIPSVYACQGYDQLLFFGRQIARRGLPLKNWATLRTEPGEDYVMSGFDYTKNNENQIVPIVKYVGGRFTKIN